MENNLFSDGFIGSQLLLLDAVPSTNDYFKQELSKSKPFPEGTVIMAVHQVAGRGQRGAAWQSEPGKNLTFSILLRPRFLSPNQAFMLSAAISLGLVDFLEAVLPVGHTVQVKWPNDVYVDGQKIAGILIENSFLGSQWRHAIVGIGLNVFQEIFPPNLADKGVTSLAILAPDKFTFDHASQTPLLDCLKQLCGYIERRYRQLSDEGLEHVFEAYHAKLYQLGREHTYVIDGVRVNGMITGVTTQGRLQVDVQGQLRSLDMKEIQFT